MEKLLTSRDEHIFALFKNFRNYRPIYVVLKNIHGKLFTFALS